MGCGLRDDVGEKVRGNPVTFGQTRVVVNGDAVGVKGGIVKRAQRRLCCSDEARLGACGKRNFPANSFCHDIVRSEERRVGKERTRRGWPGPRKKKRRGRGRGRAAHTAATEAGQCRARGAGGWSVWWRG